MSDCTQACLTSVELMELAGPNSYLMISYVNDFYKVVFDYAAHLIVYFVSNRVISVRS